MLNLDQNCTLPLVKNGKIGNTSCLIGNLNILGYTAHRLNKDNICTKLDGNPSMHTLVIARTHESVV